MRYTERMKLEEWRPIPGHEAVYAVSNLGRVRSRARGADRILRPGPMPSGHLTVALGRGNSRTVHSLVMLAFIGPCPEGQEVRHLDGDPANNHLDNLAYGTRRENSMDVFRQGKAWRKLTSAQATEIRRRLAEGETGAALAREFGVSQSQISNIKHERQHTA